MERGTNKTPTNNKACTDTDWKNKIFSKQLVKTDSRQIHFGNSFRLGNPSNREANSKNKTKTNDFRFQHESLNKSRDKNFAGKRGCEESSKHRRSIFVHSISKREKGTREIQASYKSKGTELIHSISKIQNGNSEGCEKHPSGGGLHGQNRPEGRLFCNTVASPIKEVCEIQLGRKPIRIPMPDVRIGTGSQVLYETTQSTHFTVEKVANKGPHIHRRPIDSSRVERGSNLLKGHNNLSSGESRVYNKSTEVCTDTKPTNGVSGSLNKQLRYDLQSPTRKSAKAEKVMHANVESEDFSHKEISELNRESYGNRPSLHPSTTPNKIPSKMHEHTIREKQTEIRVCNELGQPSNGGTKVVDRKPFDRKWKNHKHLTPRFNYKLRCGKGKKGRMGGPLWSDLFRRTMAELGKRGTYKCSRDENSSHSSENLCKGNSSEVSTSIDRQSGSSGSHCENGSTNKSDSNNPSQGNMVFLDPERDHSYCRVHPIELEQRSRLRVQELDRLERLEAKKEGFLTDSENLGNSRNRPICFQNSPSTRNLFQLETRPGLSSNRCINSDLGPNSRICISPILSDREVPGESTKVSNYSSSDSPNLDSPTLVPGFTGDVNLEPKKDRNGEGHSNPPIGGNTPSHSKQNTALGSVEDIREQGSSDGLSQTAATLIQQSKAKGTRRHYMSAWESFSSWCRKREIDPISSPIEIVVNYLTTLFEQGKEYNTINGHRSAISFYHEIVEGLPVGQHPLVTSLLKGVSRQRPPMPKYTEIWDIDTVLNGMKELPGNEHLQLKQLTFKTITLLGILAPNRGSELTDLDINLMGKSETTFIFHLSTPPKHFKQGKKNEPIEFRKFEGNEKLCPYQALTEYIKVTKVFREKQQTSKLFLSYVEPHKPVGKDTTARWVKEMLKIVGIDINIFQAHSKRSASSSKAYKKGANLKDILKMGNWSNASVWQKFYNKEFSSAEKYQNILLQG